MSEAEAAPTAAPAEAPPPAPETLPGDQDILAALEKPADKGDAKPEPEAKKEPTKGTELAKAPETPKESAVLRSIKNRERELQAKQQAFAVAQQQATAQTQAAIEAGIQKAIKERFADPRVAVKTLNDLGLTPQQIAEALVNKDKPSAEEVARQALEEARRLREELASKDTRTRSQADESDFLAEAKSLAAQLPHLFEEYDEREILGVAYEFARELAAECKAKGEPVPNVSNARVLRALDRRAKARQDRRAERVKAKNPADTDQAKATAQADPKAAKNGSGHQGAKTGTTATTTLGKDLGERQSVAVSDPVLMSKEDILASVQRQIAEGVNIKAR